MFCIFESSMVIFIGLCWHKCLLCSVNLRPGGVLSWPSDVTDPQVRFGHKGWQHHWRSHHRQTRSEPRTQKSSPTLRKTEKLCESKSTSHPQGILWWRSLCPVAQSRDISPIPRICGRLCPTLPMIHAALDIWLAHRCFQQRQRDLCRTSFVWLQVYHLFLCSALWLFTSLIHQEVPVHLEADVFLTVTAHWHIIIQLCEELLLPIPSQFVWAQLVVLCYWFITFAHPGAVHSALFSSSKAQK